MVMSRKGETGEGEEGEEGINGDGRRLDSGGEQTQYTHDILQNCTPENCVISLTRVTLIDSTN